MHGKLGILGDRCTYRRFCEFCPEPGRLFPFPEYSALERNYSPRPLYRKLAVLGEIADGRFLSELRLKYRTFGDVGNRDFCHFLRFL